MARTLWAALLLATLAGAPPALAGAAPPPPMYPNASNAVLPTALQNLGVLSGVVSSKTAAYTVQNSDQGGTIALGGNAFYTLTVNAPGTYTNGSRFTFLVTNTDSGRAKNLALNGTSYLIWPGQSRLIFPDGTGNWQCAGGCKQRWKLSGGALTVNIDPTNGSDSNDGLATGTGALLTIGQCLNYATDQFDFNGNNTSPTLLTCQLAAAATDTEQLHVSQHALVGAQGNAALTIDLGGGTLTAAVANQATVQAYHGGMVLILTHGTISATGTTEGCIEANENAWIELSGSLTLNCTGIGIRATAGGKIWMSSPTLTFSGIGATYYAISADDGGMIDAPSGATINLGANLTGTTFLNATTASHIDLGAITVNLNSFTFTGNQYLASQVSFIRWTGGTIPGTVGGALSLGAAVNSAVNVSAGFTGATTFNANSVLYGNGGGAIGTSAHTGTTASS